MPPRKRAESPTKNTVTVDKTAYKLGDIAEVKPGELVRRPDGTVVTSGGGHTLNVPGEYAIVSPNGDERTLTVKA